VPWWKRIASRIVSGSGKEDGTYVRLSKAGEDTGAHSTGTARCHCAKAPNLEKP